jgi:triphosphoribosyl-dephospho-CoA synthase
MNAAIGRECARALLDELRTFPKPGLVSLVDNGSHDDMRPAHFARSARVLRHAFAAMAAAGAQGADFAELRRLGVEAEVAMLRATGGINTHRGAIFSLGLLAAAAGTGASARSLGAVVRERWGADIAAHRRDPASHGSAVIRAHGVGGAQAEAAAGFPSVYDVALPAFHATRTAGHDDRAAAVQAFFALLAHVDDTNLVHRGGPEGLRFAQSAARAFLAEGGMLGPHPLRSAIAVHHALVARRLSPGGCADLLAACLFLVKWGQVTFRAEKGTGYETGVRTDLDAASRIGLGSDHGGMRVSRIAS